MDVWSIRDEIIEKQGQRVSPSLGKLGFFPKNNKKKVETVKFITSYLGLLLCLQCLIFPFFLSVCYAAVLPNVEGDQQICKQANLHFRECLKDNVPESGNLCCDEVDKLVWDQELSATIINQSGSIVAVEGGGSSLTWSISGSGFSFDESHIITDIEAGNSVTIYRTAEACGTAEITVTDKCTEVSQHVRSPNGSWKKVDNSFASCGSGNFVTYYLFRRHHGKYYTQQVYYNHGVSMGNYPVDCVEYFCNYYKTETKICVSSDWWDGQQFCPDSECFYHTDSPVKCGGALGGYYYHLLSPGPVSVYEWMCE